MHKNGQLKAISGYLLCVVNKLVILSIYVVFQHTYWVKNERGRATHCRWGCIESLKALQQVDKLLKKRIIAYWTWKHVSIFSHLAWFQMGMIMMDFISYFMYRLNSYVFMNFFFNVGRIFLFDWLLSNGGGKILYRSLYELQKISRKPYDWKTVQSKMHIVKARYKSPPPIKMLFNSLP